MNESKPEVKSLTVLDNMFEANGHKYYITEKISVRRWREYEKMVPKLTYGLGFKEIYNALQKAYTSINEKRFADSAVIVHNILSGIKDADDENRFPDALWVAALIINREGEDTSVFNEDFQREKIMDWQAEGYNMLDFFRFALNAISGFRETYLLSIQKQAEDLVQKSDLMQKME